MNNTRNSYFNTILESRALDFHDGRPLWRYNLSDKEYQDLKNHLTTISFKDFDPRDIALFFAEWWKNEYDGGSPSIDGIYNKLGSCTFSLKDFYKFARRGAIILGIRWMKSTRSFYFRTLLMQGGLPINHVLKHSTVYTNFLKKVLEINPSTIEDFSYDEEITSSLPFSSRNEAVYDSCLQIVQAIWNGDEEYLRIFENKGSATTSFKKISDELKKHKEIVAKSIKKRSKFRAYWILNLESSKQRITLDLSFPELLDQEDLKELLGITDDEIQSEYRLSVNDILVSKLKRNQNKNFKIFSISETPILYKGEETKTDIYLTDTNNKRYDLPILTVDIPKISEPTLWTQKTEYEWILNKGKNCKQEDAAVLFNQKWEICKPVDLEYIILNGEKYNWYKFSGSLEVTNQDDAINFNTNTTSFDWYVSDQKPVWVLKANMTIIRNYATVYVFNKNGEKINNFDIQWRRSGDQIWQIWPKIFPIGCIEYRITQGNCVEKDCFYNIGEMNLFFESDDERSSTIEILNAGNLQVNFKESENIEFVYIDDQITVSFLDLINIPAKLRASFSLINNRKNLIFEVLPPFFGTRLVDSNEELVKDNSELIFGQVAGYRILAPLQPYDFTVKLFNETRNDISINYKLGKSSTSLREFEEQVQRLLRLTDPMDKDSSVVMAVYNEKDELLNRYVYKNFNCTINHVISDEGVVITINNPDINCEIDLLAIPLDCHPSNIDLLPLTRESDKYLLEEFFPISKFIIIPERIYHQVAVLPKFIMVEPESIGSNIPDKQERINKIIEKLEYQSSNELAWITLRRYYQICIRNNTPFSIFDSIRAAGSSPDLAARMFCLLCIYNKEPNFVDAICKDLESDLGICFHWISASSWKKAMQWVIDSLNAGTESENIRHELQNKIQELILEGEPVQWFEKIADTIIKGKIHPLESFYLNSEVTRLRQGLGEKVISELPVKCPKIAEEYKDILLVNPGNQIVKILLKVPLAVALAMTSTDESIWHIGREAEIVRRNIQYAQLIAPEWYGKALLFSINKIMASK
jgi:hypothetical protein